MDISCLALPQSGLGNVRTVPRSPHASNSHPPVTGNSSRNALPIPNPQIPNSPIPFKRIPCYACCVLVHLTPKGASTMEWVTPQHEEIDLNCEVSSYANA